MEVYLGIDVGSVTTKLVALNAADELLASLYLPTAGKPVAMVQRGLKEIEPQLPAGSAVCYPNTSRAAPIQLWIASNSVSRSLMTSRESTLT